jgi:hypothetical protein
LPAITVTGTPNNDEYAEDEDKIVGVSPVKFRKLPVPEKVPFAGYKNRFIPMSPSYFSQAQGIQ